MAAILLHHLSTVGQEVDLLGVLGCYSEHHSWKKEVRLSGTLGKLGLTSEMEFAEERKMCAE